MCFLENVMRPSLVVAVMVLLLTLAGCLPASDPGKAIPTLLIPGRADDLDAMRRSGMPEAIHAAWPDADVLLAEVTLGYYMQGRAAERLHDEVIAPARERGGYREVWLAGASMGGMGVLMYDQRYPGEMDGLVLLAPYLGDAKLLREIGDAGGVAQWDAGPQQTMDPDNWQRELWRHIQRWSRNPEEASRVWLAYGDRDRLRKAMPLLITALPQDHVLMRKGGHTWTVWSPATGEVLQQADAKRDRPKSR
jgi:hypothetical protein